MTTDPPSNLTKPLINWCCNISRDNQSFKENTSCTAQLEIVKVATETDLMITVTNNCTTMIIELFCFMRLKESHTQFGYGHTPYTRAPPYFEKTKHSNMIEIKVSCITNHLWPPELTNVLYLLSLKDFCIHVYCTTIVCSIVVNVSVFLQWGGAVEPLLIIETDSVK